MNDARLLIIDSDNQWAETLMNLLTQQGYQVKVAPDAHEGLSIAGDWHPHAIVASELIDEIDGLPFTARLRDMPDVGNTPVIWICHRWPPRYDMDVYYSRHTDYVRVPFDFYGLNRMVKRAIPPRSRELGTATNQPGAWILFVTDDQDEQHTLSLFLWNMRQDVVACCAPEIARIEQAFRHRTPDLVLLNFFSPPGYPNGIELCRLLRANERLPLVPVVLWRISDSPTVVTEAKHAGIAGCIPYVCDLTAEVVKARDAVLAGSEYYPARQTVLRPK